GGGPGGALVLRWGWGGGLGALPRRSYGAALQYFTGSQAHGVAVRKRGVERGLRINEYGVFRVSADSKNGKAHKEVGRRVGGATEEEVYRAVGMAWVP